MARKKYARRRQYKKKVSLSKRINAAVKKATVQVAQPNYTDYHFGHFGDQGQTAAAWSISAGTGAGKGTITYLPRVTASEALNGVVEIKNSERKDNRIMVTGYSLDCQVATDAKYAVLGVYIGTTKLPTAGGTALSTSDFPNPQPGFKLDPKVVAPKRKIYYSKEITLRQKFNQDHPTKRFSHYQKFKKPFPIEFDGPLAQDWLSRKMFVAFRAQNPHELNGTGNPRYMNVTGTIRVYYRDL